jgi:hypothetical protein
MWSRRQERLETRERKATSSAFPPIISLPSFLHPLLTLRTKPSCLRSAKNRSPPTTRCPSRSDQAPHSIVQPQADLASLLSSRLCYRHSTCRLFRLMVKRSSSRSRTLQSQELLRFLLRLNGGKEVQGRGCHLLPFPPRLLVLVSSALVAHPTSPSSRMLLGSPSSRQLTLSESERLSRLSGPSCFLLSLSSRSTCFSLPS